MSNETSKLITNFSRRLAEIRRSKGLTQDALANKAGVTGGYVRLLEGGKQNVTLTTIERFADLLNCNPKVFFDIPKTKKPLPGRPKNKK
jgi:transcriptional regulator with XRE-family HTH domain